MLFRSGQNLFAEFDDQGHMLAQYTYAPESVDGVLSVYISSSGVSAGLGSQAGRYFFLKDQINSIKAITNTSGIIVQRYEYFAFGAIESIRDGNGNDIQSSPFIRTLYAFAGREFDEETGLYFNRARYYDPKTGRFLQRDPEAGRIAKTISVVNQYAYASNNPINFVDPTGRSDANWNYTPGGPSGGSTGGISGGGGFQFEPGSNSPPGAGNIGSGQFGAVYTDTTVHYDYDASKMYNTALPITSAQTYVLSLNLSGIIGAGFDLSVGMYIGTTGDGWLDAGGFASGGFGAGFNIGVSANVGKMFVNTSGLRGETYTIAEGYDLLAESQTLDLDGKFVGATGGLGLGFKVGASITKDITVKIGVERSEEHTSELQSH